MKIEIPKGHSIFPAATMAINTAKRINGTVHFDFNELEITVCPESYPPDIVRIYNLQAEIRRLNK